jgi:hypothetical protein
MSIDMMTPAEAAGCSGEIAKRWTSYRLAAIKNRMEGLDIAGKCVSLPGAVRGFLSGYALQSTSDSDKTQKGNKYQA